MYKKTRYAISYMLMRWIQSLCSKISVASQAVCIARAAWMRKHSIRLSNMPIFQRMSRRLLMIILASMISISKNSNAAIKVSGALRLSSLSTSLMNSMIWIRWVYWHNISITKHMLEISSVHLMIWVTMDMYSALAKSGILMAKKVPMSTFLFGRADPPISSVFSLLIFLH